MSQLLENVFADPKGFGIAADGRYRYELPGFTAGTAEVSSTATSGSGVAVGGWLAMPCNAHHQPAVACPRMVLGFCLSAGNNTLARHKRHPAHFARFCGFVAT